MKPTSGPFILLILIFAIFLLSSCTPIFRQSVPTGVRSEAVTDKDTDDIAVGSEPLQWDDKEFATFTSKVQGLMKNRDFAALDAMAADLRTSKARFEKGGGWKIHSFYLVTSSPENPTEAGWNALIRFLKNWNESANSIAARISLVEAYISYAWVARGTGYVAEVPPEAWPVFRERMKMAAMEMEEASILKERCYGYFEVLLKLGLAEGMERDQYERAFEEAIGYDRSYQYFYTSKAQYLMPRWSGAPGELTEFADNVRTSLGEAEGLKMYYLIVADIHDYKPEGEFFDENRFSWKKTKKGFVQFEKDHGINRMRLNKFASMSWTAKDSQAMCNTFKRLSGESDFEPSVWKDRKAFDGMKNLALNTMCGIPKIDNQAK